MDRFIYIYYITYLRIEHLIKKNCVLLFGLKTALNEEVFFLVSTNDFLVYILLWGKQTVMFQVALFKDNSTP